MAPVWRKNWASSKKGILFEAEKKYQEAFHDLLKSCVSFERGLEGSNGEKI